MSEEHKIFLRQEKKNKLIIITSQLLIFIIFLITWELLSHYQIINTFLYSSPSKILSTIIKLINNKELFKHIIITLYEVFISFSLSTIIGILIATILWFNKRLAQITDPYLTIINSLPKVALGPLIIIWVGASIRSIIFMSLLISLFTTIINIYSGFNSINKDYLIMFKSFKATKYQTFRYLILPSSLNNIIATLKINISLNLIGVIMGELLVSKQGLGYLIMYGSQVFNLDLVLTSIFILGVISYLMYFIIDKLTKKKKIS